MVFASHISPLSTISWNSPYSTLMEEAWRPVLPMTLLANHALVDGIHIARFYENLDRELAALCGGKKTED